MSISSASRSFQRSHRSWIGVALASACALWACSSSESGNATDANGGADGGGAPQAGATPGGTAGQDGAVNGGAANGGVAVGGSAGTGSGGLSAGGVGGSGATAPVNAKEAVAAMGRGVNLGQMFENTQHPRTFAAAKAKIDAYYAKGYRNVRIPITWTEAVGGDTLVTDPAVGKVNRSHPRLAVIQQVVDYALSLPGLIVIINAHHETGLKTDGRTAVLEQLWDDISELFAARSPRLVYELLNEPHRSDATNSPMDPALLRTMSGKAYAKVRAREPQRLIAIGGNQWFAANEMAITWPNLDAVGGGGDAFLMATFHHYDPWTFCGDNQGTYDDDWTEQNISNPMDTMAAWANGVGNGMPVYIGEWGVGWGSKYSTMDCNNIRAWYQQFNPKAAAAAMGTSLWDDGGWFKSFDHGSNSFNNNLADCAAGMSCAWNGADRFNAACK